MTRIRKDETTMWVEDNNTDVSTDTSSDIDLKHFSYSTQCTSNEIEAKLRKEDRKVLTLNERVEVLRLVESGTSYRKVANIFQVGRTQISNIVKRKEEILEDYSNKVPGNRKSRKKGLLRNLDVNELCYGWYKEACAEGVTVTGALLQKKALEFAKAANNDTFKASNGWLDRFRTRHNISFGKNATGIDGSQKMMETFGSVNTVIFSFIYKNI